MSELSRLQAESQRLANWKRWGPYLPDRQWATVREDYSAQGQAWQDFSHEQARSRSYRWGEDGLLGWCDRKCRLCFGIALWNGQDPYLKERLFGLTGPEGNHGEDVKECYFFLDSSPTHSYCKALYKYPQQAFPYQQLRQENARRDRWQPEFELYHSQVMAEEAYFDCFVEYAKASPEDILIRLRIVNRGQKSAPLHLLPSLWFRNTWSWGRQGEGYTARPEISLHPAGGVELQHPELGAWRLWLDTPASFLFTENESNTQALYDQANAQPFVKDAFHRYLIQGDHGAVNPAQRGSKAAALLYWQLEPGQQVEVCLRLCPESEAPAQPFGQSFADLMSLRQQECQEFYQERAPKLGPEEVSIWRQALAGLLWSKKFYHYDPAAWLQGDPVHPPPPQQRLKGRNHTWAGHLYNRDVLLLPDAWEYPWYAAWDTAFHVVPLATIDPDLAKEQLLLLLREWYLHPNGQIPAYEWNFNDVNPPVHAWAAWQVYRRDGSRDRAFLVRIFHKLLLNFTWWINRTDRDGNNVFSGGFLGLDNIGAFDRSHLPSGVELEQADATAWIAFYCLQMLHIALELAQQEPAYEDIASKFFEHFVAITYSMNTLGGCGLWDEEDGFYYDVLRGAGACRPLKIRSMVGLLALVAVDVLDRDRLKNLRGFRQRMNWLLAHRPHLVQHLERQGDKGLLALATRERLKRILQRLLDPGEFLSDYGLRSLSRYHQQHPFELRLGQELFRVGYEPGESQTPLFGGNSNWRGPIWFPVNYLLIGALEQYHKFYGDSFQVDSLEEPGRLINLQQLAQQLRRRLLKLFLPDSQGQRPGLADNPLHSLPHWQPHLWFHEYFHGDDGRGLGASHQHGWTALIAPLLEQLTPRD